MNFKGAQTFRPQRDLMILFYILNLFSCCLNILQNNLWAHLPGAQVPQYDNAGGHHHKLPLLFPDCDLVSFKYPMESPCTLSWVPSWPPLAYGHLLFFSSQPVWPSWLPWCSPHVAPSYLSLSRTCACNKLYFPVFALFLPLWPHLTISWKNTKQRQQKLRDFSNTVGSNLWMGNLMS